MQYLLYFYAVCVILMVIVLATLTIGESKGRTWVGRLWNRYIREIVMKKDEDGNI